MGYFSADYLTARCRFRDAVLKTGGRLDSLGLHARGPAGEPLTVDIGWFGTDHPQSVLLHSSGIHGVEGFAGSAIQLHFLSRPPVVARNAALVLVHILNPYGMAWLRRSNENNVDLNRNFLPQAERYQGMPEGSALVNSLLNPSSEPHVDLFSIKAAWLMARYGRSRLKEAVAAGQYEFQKGLFFGGKELQEGPRVYRNYLINRLSMVQLVVAVDVHTGLGKPGHDTLLADPNEFERLQKLFGNRVAPLDADRSVAYRLRGGLYEMLSEVFANARIDFVGQEFGTRGPLSVLYALREENRWHHYGSGGIDHPSKRRLKDAFCPRSPSWRESVLQRGHEVLERALRFLGAD